MCLRETAHTSMLFGLPEAPSGTLGECVDAFDSSQQPKLSRSDLEC